LDDDKGFYGIIGKAPVDSGKALGVLESRQFERVGDHHPISADVRIIAATNKNLEELIARKRFREDLFFRLGINRVTVWNRMKKDGVDLKKVLTI
jgi:transcriptional regulator with PAS, ATPase and Fis domain